MKLISNPFLRQHATPDRKAFDAEVEAYLQRGGKVLQLVDSETANQIQKRQDKRRRALEARGTQEHPCGVIGGIPLVSRDVIMSKKER